MEQTRQNRTAKVILTALLSVVMVLAMFFAILPAVTLTAYAEETTVDLSALTEAYTAQDGEILTGTLGGNYKITIASGATVTLDTVTINCNKDAGLTCNGATLILKGKNTVRSSAEEYPGILVADYSRLTISGDGSLDVYGATNAAGIGGRYNKDCGTIVIESGTITAHGGMSGAGIGSGNYAACSGIEISGGIVKAYGGEEGGAGIGTGAYASNCAYINISGGRIYAQGTDYEYEWGSAGIGTGVSCAITSGDSTCANITITGGNIEAVGGPGAAAIGAGSGYKFYDVEMEEEYASTSECDEILITDGVGKLKATKGNGSPQTIGGGKISRCVWGVKVLGGGAVTESPYNYLSPGPAGVIALIDEIPNPVVVNNACKNAIAAAREAYDKLETEEQKALVTNYDVLTDAEAVFAIANANEKIDALPAVEDITVADKDKVEAARAAYDALGDKKDEIDPEKVAKLEAAEAKYAEVKEADDTAKANSVSEKVNALPAAETITVENKEAIESARAEYDKLTEDQLKKLPDGTLTKLEAAEQALKIAIVEDLINQIPDTFTLETLDEIKEKIDAARAAYDKLSDDEQKLVDENKYETLTDAESSYIVWDALKFIKAIPDEIEYTPECKAAIDAAREAFDAVPENDKVQISKSDRDKLSAAEEAYKALDDQAKASQVETLITNIGTVELTVNSKALIDTAREAYDALTEAQQAFVKNYTVLTTAESTYKALGVKDVIANIGTVEYTVESKAKIDAAREAYDALTADQKALVDNATTLTTAETTYTTLKTDNDAADAVKAKINAIDRVEYTAESKAKIDEARAAYDALSADQKALVDNATTLTTAETTYTTLKTDNEKADAVKTLIESIGVVEYNSVNKQKIDEAKAAYEALTPEQKALVTNYSVLTAAEETYTEKEAEATANKGLSGGAIAGIVIGVIFGAILLACCAFAIVWFVVKKKTWADFTAIFKKK